MTGASRLCWAHSSKAAGFDTQEQGDCVVHTGARRLGKTHRGKAAEFTTNKGKAAGFATNRGKDAGFAKKRGMAAGLDTQGQGGWVCHNQGCWVCHHSLS